MIETQTHISDIQPQRPGAPRKITGDEYKVTHPGNTGSHVGSRLTQKLDTHRWHVLRYSLQQPDKDNPPETYEALMWAKTITPDGIKKIVKRAWCARQIMWPDREIGILFEVGRGYYLATPGIKYVARDPANRKISLAK